MNHLSRLHGLNYGYMNDGVIKLMNSEAGREAMENAGNFFGLIKTILTLLKELKALNREMLKDSWNAAQAAKPELVIFHPKAMGGSHIAEKLGVPAIMAVLVPVIVPTVESVAIGFPNCQLGPLYNKLSYTVLHKGYHAYDDIINEFRQEQLGIVKIPLSTSPIQMANGKPIPVLHGYSELVSPRPRDWPNTAYVTGYWFLAEKSNWQAPVELINFLEAGEKPVYVGFGSMAGLNPQRMANLVVDALQKASVRGIIATGGGGMEASNLRETIFKIDRVPHSWLFSRVAAVVHHGGAGTTAAGLRAGVPTIVCPFMVDQPYWGERVYALGVGTKPIPQKKLTAKKLAEAIREVTTDQVIRQNAKTLGEKIRSLTVLQMQSPLEKVSHSQVK
ncbi:MAG: glycosyltransferase [Prochloraceae cyanobacterium]|nr:glycosyltransferase [Prochloraceae cyanobacterium]